MNFLIKSFLIAIYLLSSWGSNANDVVLQLKWEHEFQFAGYYAAKWQGFYQQHGIDVEIKPAITEEKKILSPLQELQAGRADFAIGSLDILLAKDKGEDLIILAPIMQHSASSIITLGNNTINVISDLIGMRVAITEGSYLNDEIMSIFRFHGVDPSKVTFVNTRPTIDKLISGEVDAVVTFGISALYQAKTINQPINVIEMSKFGADFFGDVLYTNRRVYENNPQLVKDFVKASLDGWLYALNNRNEISNKISDQLTRQLIIYDDIHGYNQHFSNSIDPYIEWPHVELGYIDFNRWQNLFNDLKYIGLIENDWSIEDLFIQESIVVRGVWMVNILIAILIILLISGVYLIYQTSRYKPLMLFSAIAIYFICSVIETNLVFRYQQKLKLETLFELESIKSNLAGMMNSNISLLKGLAAYISNNPEIDQQAFEAYTKQIFKSGHALVNFAAAPDLIVSLVYPFEQNKAVVGLDYTTNINQINSVLKASESSNIVLDGPLKLVQGGNAIIGRIAIYEQGNLNKFWGILSAPIDIDVLLSMAGVYKQDLVSEVAIQKADENNKIIHGKNSLFIEDQSVKVNLNLADVSWQLAAKPIKGWGYPSARLWLWRLIAVAILILWFYMLYLRSSQKIRNKQYREMIKRNERLLVEVGELAQIGGWRLGIEGQFLQWTASTVEVLGEHFPVQMNHIKDFYQLFPADEAKQINIAVTNANKKGIPFDLEVKYYDINNQVRWIRLISDELIEQQEGYEVTGAIQDITYYKNINELLEYQATFDNLTGLFNRYSLDGQVNKLINRIQNHDLKLMAMFIDIDDFKSINDTLGHHAGDQFLIKVSQVLKSSLGEDHVLARYSGDEFVAIVQFEQLEEAKNRAQELMELMRQEFNIDGAMVLSSCSIGVAFYPEHSQSVEELINKADMAMYEAKRKGKNAFAIYSAKLQAKAEKKAAIRAALQNAINTRDFEVYYQPIQNFQKGRTVKFEALLRWFDKDGNPYDTEEFIAVAEESGLILEIDEFVLSEVSKDMRILNENSADSLGITLNVSPLIFTSQQSVLNRWLNNLQELRLITEVTVEITERIFIENPQRTLEILHQLNERKIYVAIDDFGVGYSSLNYLTQFPIQQIKIDKSFINQIGKDRRINALIKTIMRIADEIDLEVVAEGIETSEQLSFLVENRCYLGQGYLFSKGLPMREIMNQYAIKRA